jgi:hypothetical protein
VRILTSAILVAALAWAPAAAATPPPVRAGAPVSAHAMVHTCCTPAAMKERIFAEAKAMGARFIRVDVELSGIFGGGAPDWARLDEVMELSESYQLPVLGILLDPPAWVSPLDAPQFAHLAGEVAAHARDTITRWEIINEPDGSWAWLTGTPEDYARILRATYNAIATRVPEAEVVLGGLMTAPNSGWIERVFATPGADAAHAFDIASVNVRDAARRLPGRLAAWRTLLERYGFTGPLWVTEHGYSGDLTYQNDPAYRGGEAAQAAFLTESVLRLAQAGASEVFVTLRDNLSDRFLYWEFHEGGFHQAVRWGNWKAYRRGLGGTLELYDLESDPGEANDIAARHPDVVARIEEYLRTARTDSYEYRIAESD